MLYDIFQYGNQIELDIRCNPCLIIKDLKKHDHKWSQYNTLRPEIPRQGLCVINEKGYTGPGPALNSIPQWNEKFGTDYDESVFDKPTEVYRESINLQNLLSECLNFTVRTHFLKLLPGGYFPPHRDSRKRQPVNFRAIVPIQNTNPPHVKFMLEDQTLRWNEGTMYIVNTNLEHTLMNYSRNDSIWLVMNFLTCDASIDFVLKNLAVK